MRRLVLTALFLFWLGLPARGQEYALRVGWLVDGTGAPARRNVVLIVRDGRLRAVLDQLPPGWKSEVRDYSADTAIPGLVDAHGHLALIGVGDEAEERMVQPANRKDWVLRNARTALASGVTTLRDPGTYPWTLQLRKEIERTGLRWIPAGRQLVKRAPDAYQSEMFLEFEGAEDARAKVRQLRREGAAFIKLRFSKQRPLPTLAEAQAIAEEAHRLGLKVAAHTDVPHDEAVELALAAGVDTLEHNAALRAAHPEQVWPQIVARRIVVVPGMGNWEAKMDCLSVPPEEIIEEPLRSKLAPELRAALAERARELRGEIPGWMKDGFDPGARRQQALAETRRAHGAGVLLAAGPDTGIDLMPHGRLYKDLFWYAEAGLPIEEVVRIGTLNGARAAGLETEIGSLEPGKRADIVILQGDVSTDYRRLKEVLLVIRDGRMVFRAPDRD